MKVAILQYRVPASYEEAVAKAISYVEQAAAQGADVVLLPELFEGPYFCQIEDYENFKKAEVRKTSKTLATFQAVAKKSRVVLPVSFFEKDGNCYFNSLEMFDKDGRDLGLYRKSHIPTGECYEEKFYFAPGNTGFKVFKTEAGRIGCGICWDQWFPETHRILALKGAELLLFPTAIGSEPVLVRDSMPHWRNTMAGQAAANLVPLAASNRVGLEKAGSSEMKFLGYSFVADQHGEIVTSMDREEEGIRLAEFDLPKIEEERYSWGVFRDRRIDLYGPLLRQGSSEMGGDDEGDKNPNCH